MDLLSGIDLYAEVLPNSAGFVRLVDVSPRLVDAGDTADSAIVDAARVSYGKGTKKVNEDRHLIRYLLRHLHTTPFEMVTFKFHIRMPKFVYSQFFRHRTSDLCEIEIISNDETARGFVSMNEYSARYSVVPDTYWIPDPIRTQSSTNKQGSEAESPELTAKWKGTIHKKMEEMYQMYDEMLKDGVSREVARCILPVSYITEFYVTFNLWNLMHFLQLRCHSHAQYEIRQFASVMAGYMARICPEAHNAWNDYILHGTRLSAMELRIIQDTIAGLSITGDNPLTAAMQRAAPNLSSREFKELLFKLGVKENVTQ